MRVSLRVRRRKVKLLTGMMAQENKHDGNDWEELVSKRARSKAEGFSKQRIQLSKGETPLSAGASEFAQWSIGTGTRGSANGHRFDGVCSVLMWR